ncbi:DEAD/DEAH box helicase [Falsibacillus pallidus]|uniref:DEAD-box ATP-dependent RNA helicase CshB n=1 Tax=Falsibacillus pallidus TaxID=493781 RepID=A0A370GNI0_9BACI|nr:DEAD/DEAH box helicase [Falsibacillus pallidus]RDI43984.1 ATP-dependent RNA helicase CshB [Falsibacillus pallidus]
MANNQFEHFSFKPFINTAIQELGFKKPTEIQEKMIPAIIKGESSIGQSQTGTGKTHAYLLPILQKIDPERNEVQAVITAPTRELANQIYKEVLKITKFSEEPITARCFIGGTDKQRTIDKLKNQPHIVVGTAGRINDLVKENALFVHSAEMLIVDEADLMLDMGFIHEVDQVASRMPEKLQMLVFSATIPEKLKPFLKKYLENPSYQHVQPKQLSAEKIQHVLVPLKSRKKINLLHDMLISYNSYLAIVFTNTKANADYVADALIEKGLKVGRIHGDLSPRDRKKMMKQITNLEFQYIVATDLAARGIDIEGVSHVVNYELPSDLDFYVHRSGRTARAGLSGVAATIYSQTDEDALNKLEKMGIEFITLDLQGKEWVEISDRNRRKKRVKQTDDFEKKARGLIKKPSKVKPGYKKKMQRQIDTMKKRERRLNKKK